MKKSIQRCIDEAAEKYTAMCGTPLDQQRNQIEGVRFEIMVKSGIVIPTEIEYAVQDCDIDDRFIDEFPARLW